MAATAELFQIHTQPSFEGLSDSAVLAEFLYDVSSPAMVADKLFGQYGSLTRMMVASPQALARVPGMTPAAAKRLAAVQALSERRMREQIGKRTVISSWSQVLAFVKLALEGKSKEGFYVLFLDRKNQLIAWEQMQHGTVDHCPVYPREVVKRALELDASAIILVHNHPSGDPTPSAADVEMTRHVVEAGRGVRVSVHDHLVVGTDGVASLKALGLF